MSKKFQTEEKSEMVRDIMSKKIVSMNADTSTLELAGSIGLCEISKIKVLGSVSRGVAERATISCPVMLVH